MDTLFIDRQSGDELTEALFRRVNRKRASFGDTITPKVAGMLGYDYLIVLDPPAYDSSTHKAVPKGRVSKGSNTWERGWEIAPLNGAELDARAQEYAARIEQAKASRKGDINTWRVQADRESFTFGGKQIAADDDSIKQIFAISSRVALVGDFPPNWPGGWKATDNTYVLIDTVALWSDFVAAMSAQGAANFAHQQQLKADVDAASTLGEVEAIEW